MTAADAAGCLIVLLLVIFMLLSLLFPERF